MLRQSGCSGPYEEQKLPKARAQSYAVAAPEYNSRTLSRESTMIVNTPKAVPKGICKQSNPATMIENVRFLLCNRKIPEMRLTTDAITNTTAKNTYIQMKALRRSEEHT